MTFGRKPGLSLRVLASTLLASLLLVLALAANPHWHALAHAEASHGHAGQGPHEHEGGGHTCAVDLFLAGSVHHASPAPLLLAVPAATLARRFIAATEFVASVFHSGSILEHAPPAIA